MNRDEINEYLRSPEPPVLRYFPHAVAAQLSDLAAILLYDLRGRLKRQRKPLIKDKTQWTFDAMRVFAENHLYAKESGIRKAFLALEAAGLVLIEKSGKYNHAKYDRKWWFYVTTEGIAAAQRRRIRFVPGVAAVLDIPKAVLLETFRHHFHETGEPVTMNPDELQIPYSPKTIGRHLEALVQAGILRRPEADMHRYVLPPPAADWRTSRQPLTVPVERLLPQLNRGEVGLLVGHSGNGKTSYSSFLAVQHAVAGKKVLYITLEEPATDIIHRMYAGEFAVSYSALHQGDQAANEALQAAYATHERRAIIAANLKIEDLSGGHSQTHEVLDAILRCQEDGFAPDIVMIDQLEFISVEHAYADEAAQDDADEFASSTLGNALAPALLIRECLGERSFVTWVLHQVNGASQIDFELDAISGGVDVADQFDCVVGIGRETPSTPAIRVFSMVERTKFDRMLDASFAQMRFLPQRIPGQK